MTVEPPHESSAPAPASAHVRVLAQGLYETRNVLRNGEQLLVSLLLPLMVLIGVHRLDLVVSDSIPSIDVLTPGVIALAVMATGFTGQESPQGSNASTACWHTCRPRRWGPLGSFSAKPWRSSP
ncbi:hypothetical protein [Nesterenkonia pannonica]|uniref:hypothetical protein n=1 Tax=Nesterenkonia pannonica TaxID=1548602 RepID=UPI002164067E|nr:hypothetical protein [Nesterenkonia pannonica]